MSLLVIGEQFPMGNCGEPEHYLSLNSAVTNLEAVLTEQATRAGFPPTF